MPLIMAAQRILAVFAVGSSTTARRRNVPYPSMFFSTDAFIMTFICVIMLQISARSSLFSPAHQLSF
jgi:hypothetical protein